MEALANKDLQLGVRASDPRHLCGSLLGSEAINQCQAFAFFLTVLADFCSAPSIK